MTLLSSAYVSIPLKLYLYLGPFLRYSASNNSATLKLGIGRSRSLNMAPFDRL